MRIKECSSNLHQSWNSVSLRQRYYSSLFVNDIEFSPNLERHIKLLRQVFQWLRALSTIRQVGISSQRRWFSRKSENTWWNDPYSLWDRSHKEVFHTKKIILFETFRILKTVFKNFAKITKSWPTAWKNKVKIEPTCEFLNTFKQCKNILMNGSILQFPRKSRKFY